MPVPAVYTNRAVTRAWAASKVHRWVRCAAWASRVSASRVTLGGHPHRGGSPVHFAGRNHGEGEQREYHQRSEEERAVLAQQEPIERSIQGYEEAEEHRSPRLRPERVPKVIGEERDAGAGRGAVGLREGHMLGEREEQEKEDRNGGARQRVLHRMQANACDHFRKRKRAEGEQHEEERVLGRAVGE